ncbi:MAG: TonB family protein [Acidobacteria bacterium]|nr:TonB family protein [Acidobacteriota bacterium]
MSVRYAEEIAELRDFLGKAGVPVGTTEAIGEIAKRLSNDRGFHRDLMSYVWVEIDRCGRQIGFSGLLGVVTVAAAGEHLAAAADEDAAHGLLGFLMEAWHSLDHVVGNHAPAAQGMPVTREQSAARRFVGPEAAAVAEPLQIADSDSPAIFHEPTLMKRNETSSTEVQEKSSGKRKRAMWGAVIAACVLVAALLGWWMYRNSDIEQSRRSPVVAPVVLSVPNPAAPSAALSGEATSASNGAIPVVATEHGRAQSPRMNSSAPAASSRMANVRTLPGGASTARTDVAPQSIGDAHALSPAQTMASISAAPVVRSAAPSPGAVPVRVAPRTAASAGTAAVPADILSKRLGARTMPEDLTPYGIETTGRKHPELKRRQPQEASVVAEVRSMPGSSSSGSPGAARGEIVRVGSEGIMSENLLYSPAPVYPAAASAARVAGEVRVQASIDRDGNVAAARVISGPPLLRDAALDAVHQWRFRPRVSHGKPAPSSATAVLDFELP